MIKVRSMFSKNNINGFTLIELVVITGIIAVLFSIMVPSFTHYLKSVNETVCTNNRNTIERLYEAALINTNDEISFNMFIEEYSDEICLDGGVISYEEDEVKCSKHTYNDEPPHEEVPWL